MQAHKDASTITDVCTTNNIPEVDLVSLIQDQIPRYKLRANTATPSDYTNLDWSQQEVNSADPDSELGVEDLTPVQLAETLKYFTLCSSRVMQMCHTYNDVDAITRLLEEKEKDLELAAKIGQSLLVQNRLLTQKNESLEELLNQCNEKASQLKHEVAKKDDLLQVFIQDHQEMDSDTEEQQQHERQTLESSIKLMTTLQNRIKSLEGENQTLRVHSVDLQYETDSYESKEKQLVDDCIKQLGESQVKIQVLREELEKKIGDYQYQAEEKTRLLSQLADLQHKYNRLSIDHEEIMCHLQASKECQDELASEVVDLREKFAECLEMLHEAQEELKKTQKKTSSTPKTFYTPHHGAISYFPGDSLASEIENSVRKELSQNAPLSSPRLAASYSNLDSSGSQNSLKVLRTVRCAEKYRRDKSTKSSVIASPVPSQHSGRSTPHIEPSDSGFVSSKSVTSLGRPGVPGSNDLETALRRLSVRRHAEMESKIFQVELSYRDKGINDGDHTPCPSPDSIMSTGTVSNMSGFSGVSSGMRSYMPEKLQIVKPLEGSQTLHQWQSLAWPKMDSLLDVQPGVHVKGFRDLEFDNVYNLSDYEEDDISYSGMSLHVKNAPTKSFSTANATYTYTTSRILHPTENDFTKLTSSCVPSTSFAQLPPNLVPTSPHSSFQRSTSTFSTSYGLASLLHERGIGAAIPMSKPSQTGITFTSSTTSGTRPVSSSFQHPSQSSQQGRHTTPLFMSTSAPRPTSLIKQAAGRETSKDLKERSIMNRVKNLGLDNLLSTKSDSAQGATAAVTIPGRGRTRRLSFSKVAEMEMESCSPPVEIQGDFRSSKLSSSSPNPLTMPRNRSFENLGPLSYLSSGALNTLRKKSGLL